MGLTHKEIGLLKSYLCSCLSTPLDIAWESAVIVWFSLMILILWLTLPNLNIKLLGIKKKPLHFVYSHRVFPLPFNILIYGKNPNIIPKPQNYKSSGNFTPQYPWYTQSYTVCKNTYPKGISSPFLGKHRYIFHRSLWLPLPANRVMDVSLLFEMPWPESKGRAALFWKTKSLSHYSPKPGEIVWGIASKIIKAIVNFFLQIIICIYLYIYISFIYILKNSGSCPVPEQTNLHLFTEVFYTYLTVQWPQCYKQKSTRNDRLQSRFQPFALFTCLFWQV